MLCQAINARRTLLTNKHALVVADCQVNRHSVHAGQLLHADPNDEAPFLHLLLDALGKVAVLEMTADHDVRLDGRVLGLQAQIASALGWSAARAAFGASIPRSSCRRTL